MNDSAVDNKDCLACRLSSGCGLMAIGVYVYNKAKYRGKIEGNFIKIIAAGAIGLGVARLLNMEFLKNKKT